VVGGAWLGHVNDEALTVGAAQTEYLVSEVQRADERVPDDPVPRA
jgi:hypothetical protein